MPADKKTSLTFCYFGIYAPIWARDTVLLRGLEERGDKIIFITDLSPGWRKYFRLIAYFRRSKQSYDYLLVGYLSNIIVPLARILSSKPVIFNAGNSMYEGAVLDRGHYSWFKKERYLWLVDFLAFHAAHLVVVETEAQKRFISKLFWLQPKKLLVLPIGIDDAAFHPDQSVAKRDKFTVLFRGWFVPATGVEYVLQAAARLKNEDVNFLLIGRGPLTARVKEMVQGLGLEKVEVITEFLAEERLRRLMLSCQLMLGQFSGHPRLERTIQNKTFEALALGLPLITQDSKSNRELLTDGVNCLFVKPADAGDLAEKILKLKNDRDLCERLSQNGRKTYETRLTPKIIANQFLANLKHG